MNYTSNESETNAGNGTFNREGVFGGESEKTISHEEKEENTVEGDEDNNDTEEDDDISGQEEIKKEQ